MRPSNLPCGRDHIDAGGHVERFARVAARLVDAGRDPEVAASRRAACRRRRGLCRSRRRAAAWTASHRRRRRTPRSCGCRRPWDGCRSRRASCRPARWRCRWGGRFPSASSTRVTLPSVIDAIDALDVHLQVAAVGAVARIGEPDAALAHRRSSRWGCCSACPRTCRSAPSTLPVFMSVRTMRRRPGPCSPPSQLMSRPLASKQLPLVRPLSARKTVTAPLASIFRMRLPAMSLKKTLPSASTAGPSRKQTTAAAPAAVLAARRDLSAASPSPAARRHMPPGQSKVSQRSSAIASSYSPCKVP